MPKAKNNNYEKGSIAVYAIATTLCFLIILGGIFTFSSGIRKNELKTLIKIKEIYAQKVEVVNREPEQKEYTFAYTGSSQNFVAPADGVYRLQVWGAQGGSYSSYGVGGKRSDIPRAR